MEIRRGGTSDLIEGDQLRERLLDFKTQGGEYGEEGAQ